MHGRVDHEHGLQRARTLRHLHQHPGHRRPDQRGRPAPRPAGRQRRPDETLLPTAGSPAYDRIPAANALCTDQLTDQRGVSRPQDLRLYERCGRRQAQPRLQARRRELPGHPRRPPEHQPEARPAQPGADCDHHQLGRTDRSGREPVRAAPGLRHLHGPDHPGRRDLRGEGRLRARAAARRPPARWSRRPPASRSASALSGTALSQAVAWLGPAAFAFPHTPVGKRSAQQKFTLENRGDQTLTVSSVSLTGTNPTQFAIMPLTTTCAPGTALARRWPRARSRSAYTPMGAGSHGATLSVSTDDPDHADGDERAVGHQPLVPHLVTITRNQRTGGGVPWALAASAGSQSHTVHRARRPTGRTPARRRGDRPPPPRR